MKKVILILIAFGMNALVAQTNTTTPTPTLNSNPNQDGITIPTTVTNKFKADYGNVSPNWAMDGENYSAVYTDQVTNLGNTIVYDRNGNVVRTENEMNNTAYPKTISDYYTKNYPNESYEVWSNVDANGNKTYYSKRKSGTLWFDKNGRYMSTKPIPAGSSK